MVLQIKSITGQPLQTIPEPNFLPEVGDWITPYQNLNDMAKVEKRLFDFYNFTVIIFLDR